MAELLVRGDAVREYLTGAGTDGGSQPDPSLSLGGKRSSYEALSLGISIVSPIANVYIDFASGGNGAGLGFLQAVDSTHLSWTPPGATTPGPPVDFTGVGTQGVVEADGQAGKYLRLTATTPFATGTSQVTLSYLFDNVYGFTDVSVSDALAGVSQYRATLVKNVSAFQVQGMKRWIGQLAPFQTASSGLGATGAGTIATAGTFSGWPTRGWCQVRSSVGTLKEVVYYSSRLDTALTVPSAGRSLLGTSASAFAAGDKLYSVPGIAIGLAAEGVQASGSSIQLVANQNTAPAGVTWSVGIDDASGLNVGTLLSSQQVGVWMWRQIPAGALSTPFMLCKVSESFNTY